MNVAQYMVTTALRGYRVMVSPVLSAISAPFGFGCRFEPTCSCYAIGAVERHGAVKGCLLAMWRICRCHPFGGSGSDPVPESFHLGLWRKAEGEQEQGGEDLKWKTANLKFEIGKRELGVEGEQEQAERAGDLELEIANLEFEVGKRELGVEREQEQRHGTLC